MTFLLTIGLRIGIRTLHAYCLRIADNRLGCLGQPLISPRDTRRPGDPKRILIAGAGSSGESLLREILDNIHLSYNVIGFLDDDPGKHGRSIRRVPVFGPVAWLPQLVEQHSIDLVVITMPAATGAQIRRVVEICKRGKVPYKTLPAIGKILDGHVSVNALRDVSYEDLLGRPPVKLDMDGIREYLTSKTILVTGAGGSIGSELSRQLAQLNPAQLILVDAGESSLFNIGMELRNEFGCVNHRCVLAHVQNRPLMERIFSTYRPEIVFHAAAYKHVPILERNPWEAVFNNVMGSRIVMELSSQYKAGRFVLVSTDKAVRPTNVMGTSKRLAELLMQSMPATNTRFMAVRFGNVVGSSGSVIPLFRRQIEKGGPLTVTHPEVTRYFMSIPEAARLILQAGAFGNGGEIFVLEMGTPVKIAEMAEDLIRLSGKEPGKDIEIVFTGLRAGEKLYEELITASEDVVRTRHEKIMVLKANGRWNWKGLGSREVFCRWLQAEVDNLILLAGSYDASAIKRKLQEIVPSYQPQSAEAVIDSGKNGSGKTVWSPGESNVKTASGTMQ